MASTGALPALAGLVGRERECAVIDALVDQALDGQGAALVVRGEPGIGKSALLDYAAGKASGFLILRAAGVDAETDLAFAGLYGLVRPVIDKLVELPELQRAALAGALGLASSTQADRLLVSAAVLGLLAAAAEVQPVLCVIDDAQWVDRPSADGLVFAARRLRAEHLAMLFSAREGEDQRFEAPGLPDLQAQPLSVESARILASGRIGAAAPAVRERLLAGPPAIRWRCWNYRWRCPRGSFLERRPSRGNSAHAPPPRSVPTAHRAASRAHLRGASHRGCRGHRRRSHSDERGSAGRPPLLGA